MAELKHTPGPWGRTKSVVYGPMQTHVCTLGIMSHNEANANGKLISAAPDLLEACMRFMAYDKSNCQDETASYEAMKSFIVAAIAKATGNA